MWTSWVGLALTSLVVAGCAASDSAAPVGGLDDADCRQAPWLPTRVPAEVRVEACESERSFMFVSGRGGAVSDTDANRFLDAHRAELHSIEGVSSSGFGLCCIEDEPKPDTLCVSFGLRMCTTPPSAFIGMVRGIQARDDSVARGALRVSVEIEGLTGPRCDANDPACGPIPYTRNARAVPEQRRLIETLPVDAERCSHDGECVANGCGNGCDHWTLGGEAGTCPFIGALANAFCGCLQERCVWFE